jgi:hypothetical protein
VADKSVLKAKGKICTHPHCKVCGGCLLDPVKLDDCGTLVITGYIHSCPGAPVDALVLESFVSHIQPRGPGGGTRGSFQMLGEQGA